MMLNRRDFLKATGSLTVYFSMSPLLVDAASPSQGKLPKNLAANPALDAWIRIDADGSVTVFSGKSELGQGIRTALAQITAEELDVTVDRLRMAPVDTAHSPDESYTFSSISVQHSGSALRAAAAEARYLLLEMAAKKLTADIAQLDVNDGHINANGKPTDLDYWQLLGGKNFEVNATGKGEVKTHRDYQIVGQSVKRVDIPAKVFAESSYIQDLRFSGMLHARIVRPQSAGATLQTINSQAIEKLPGVVKVVRDGSFLAVIAEREEQAVQAARKLKAACTWSKGHALPDNNNLAEWLQSASSDKSVISEKGSPGLSNGSPDKSKRISAHYTRPYQAHASLSPSMALARRDSKGLTVWSHGQGMYPLRGAIARVTGLQEEQVRCIHEQASGCYGHNGADDAACDAAIIAMHYPEKHIRLQYSRDDEFRWEPYGSAMAMQVEATLDDNGNINDWQYHVWSCTHSTRPGGARGAGNLIAAGQINNAIPAPAPFRIPPPAGGGDRNSIPIYDFPNQQITKHFVKDMPLRVSALRALGAFANVFAVESFMDELALAAATDPLQFRLAHLKDKRAIDVLKKLAEISDWSKPLSQNNQGKGLAFAQYKNAAAYCAVAVIVTIDQNNGNIKLDHAFSAVDTGQIINPDGVRNQIEGGIIQGASWTLKEQVQFTRESISSHDWQTYPVISFDEVPSIKVALIDRPDSPPLGVGEASQGPIAAAIANAVANATGKRLRDLPLATATLLATSKHPDTIEAIPSPLGKGS